MAESKYISRLRNIWRQDPSRFWISLSILFAALTIFLISPVRSLGETQYTMMVAYTVLCHGTFVLDRDELRLPEQLEMIGDTSKVRRLPLEVVNARVYKYAPPGSAVLSLPFVAAASAFRLTPVDGQGAYDPQRELTISAILAALLMSAFAVVCFQTLRLLLSVPWSLAITLVATFGTQVWSTASRVVEPDSWTVLLLMIALYLLVSAELGKHKFRPILLATILSWCYLVHPTASISIVAITVYVVLHQRRNFLPFALTGAGWFLLLAVYSWLNFRQILPNYFQANRLGFETFWEALVGNLVSPSRGLLVYVPALLFLVYCLVRYRRFMPLHRLVVLGTIVAVVHLFVISGFSHWWAGHSYGPRYWTSLIPWFVVLAGAGVQGMINARAQHGAVSWGWKVQVAVAVLLAMVGILIHARGALAEETHLWNARPYDIDLRAGRLWSWRYPQFLAGLVHPPLPDGVYPLAPLNEPVDLTAAEANKFLWYGWSNPEPQIRWSEDKSAAVVFAVKEDTDLSLNIRVAPFVVRGLKEKQRVSFKLNGEEINTATLTDATATELSITLPRRLLKRENVLVFDLPDAESPAHLRLSNDQRLLALAVQWIEFRTIRDGSN